MYRNIVMQLRNTHTFIEAYFSQYGIGITKLSSDILIPRIVLNTRPKNVDRDPKTNLSRIFQNNHR